jgi:hypothetical protein
MQLWLYRPLDRHPGLDPGSMNTFAGMTDDDHSAHHYGPKAGLRVSAARD